MGAGTSELWEILVPTVRNDGRPIRTRFHRIWDQKVREITGGLTVMPVARGQWESSDGELFLERMIPVRIACSREQIEQIMAMSATYYEQYAIVSFRVSDLCLITEYPEVMTTCLIHSVTHSPRDRCGMCRIEGLVD